MMNQPGNSNGLNFEAIPCVLRNGNGNAPVYGLLVRPITQGSVVLQSQSATAGPVQTVLPTPYQTILPAVSSNKVFLSAAQPTVTVSSTGFNSGLKSVAAGPYGNSGGNFVAKPLGTADYGGGGNGDGVKITTGLNPFFIPTSAVQNFNVQRATNSNNGESNSQAAYQMCTGDNGFMGSSQQHHHQQQISSCLTDVSAGPSQASGVASDGMQQQQNCGVGQRNSDSNNSSAGPFMQNSGYYVVNSGNDPGGGGQLGQLSSSGNAQLDHFLQEIDAGDLAQLLPELVGEGQNDSYLNLDSSTLGQAHMYETFDHHSNYNSQPSTSDYCGTTTSSANGGMNGAATDYQFDRAQNNSAVINSTKPVCQYQNLLTSSNLRVGYQNSTTAVRSSEDPFSQPVDMITCSSGHNDGNSVGCSLEPQEFRDFSPTRGVSSNNRRQSQNGSTLMNFNNNANQPYHLINAGDPIAHRNVPVNNKDACGGSPDSGIQSIEGSPGGCQSSPFPLASPSPLSQASPRVYGHNCNLTAPYCPNQDLVGQRQQQPYGRSSHEPHAGCQSDLNQPLSIQTSYEAVSDPDATPPLTYGKSAEMVRPKETTSKKRKSRAQPHDMPTVWSGDESEKKKKSKETDKPVKTGSKAKGKRNSFADMPVLKPEMNDSGASKMPKSPSKNRSNLTPARPTSPAPMLDEPPMCSPVEKNFVDDKLDAFNRKFEALRKNIFAPTTVEQESIRDESDPMPSCSTAEPVDKEEKIGDKSGLLTLNLTDPTSVVDNILKAMKPDQLESFTKVFEEKLKATQHSDKPLVELLAKEKKKRKKQPISRGKPKNYELKFRSTKPGESETPVNTCGYASDTSSVSRKSAVASVVRPTKVSKGKEPKGDQKATTSKPKCVPKATELMAKLQDYRMKSRSHGVVSQTFMDELEKLNQKISEVLTIDPLTDFKFSSTKAFGFCVENFLLNMAERQHLAEETQRRKDLEEQKRLDSAKEAERLASAAEEQKRLESLLEAERLAVEVEMTKATLAPTIPAVNDNLSNLEVEASDDDESQPAVDPKLSLSDVDSTLEMEKLRIATLSPLDTTVVIEQLDERPQLPKIKISIRHNAIMPTPSTSTADEIPVPPKKRISHADANVKKRRKNDSVQELTKLMKPLKVEVSRLSLEETTRVEQRASVNGVEKKCQLSPSGSKKKRYVTNIYPWDRVKLKAKSTVAVRRCRLCPTETSSETRLCPTCVQLPFNTRVALLKQKRQEGKKWRRAKTTTDGGLKCKFVLRKSATGTNPVKDEKTEDFVGSETVAGMKSYLTKGKFADESSPDAPFSLKDLLSPLGMKEVGDKSDFKLPADVLRQGKQLQKLLARDYSKTFTKLKNNMIVDSKTSINCHTSPSCNCKPQKIVVGEKEIIVGCKDDCLNRMMLYECDAQQCPCGEACANQTIQKRMTSGQLEKFDTGSRGSGVRTKQDIPDGAFICEYVGEVVNSDTFWWRMSNWYKDSDHHYALNVDGNTIIDAYRYGGIARFINHSCEPNCEMQKWSVNGQFRMAVFAKREIRADEELSYNYNFHSFSSQQVCLCEKPSCKGFIGGKAQKADKRKGVAQTGVVQGFFFHKRLINKDPSALIQLHRPLSYRERVFIQGKSAFLLRSIDKVRRKLQWSTQCPSTSGDKVGAKEDVDKKKAEMILAQLTALKTCRSVRTRHLAQSEENVEIMKLARLIQILKTLLSRLKQETDEHGEPLISPFISLPSKKKTPELFEKISDPIDFDGVEKNLTAGVYGNPHSFDADVRRVFSSFRQLYNDIDSVEFRSLQHLQSLYTQLKRESIEQLQSVVGFVCDKNFTDENDNTAESPMDTDMDADDLILPPLPAEPQPTESCRDDFIFVNADNKVDEKQLWLDAKNDTTEEDKVRCVCGIHEEDGSMVMCETCLFWQHQECVTFDEDADYVCDLCQGTADWTIPRAVKLKVLPEIFYPECCYYRSMMKDNMQIRYGECVYVQRIEMLDEKYKAQLRSFNRDIVQKSQLANSQYSDEMKAANSSSPNVSPLAREMSAIVTFPDGSQGIRRSELRIFRIERLFERIETGDQFAFGSYFARPGETFSEPTRRFFQNELCATPIYDTLPLSAIVSRCLVLDAVIYPKGRPKLPKYNEADVYVCEFRLDRGQKLFAKTKYRVSVNTKSYIFDSFPQKMKMKREFAPFPFEVYLKRKKTAAGRMADAKRIKTEAEVEEERRREEAEVARRAELIRLRELKKEKLARTVDKLADRAAGM